MPSKSDKTCKILFEKTSEEEWLAFQSQSTAFLPKIHDLDVLGIQALLDTAADGNDALLALDLDAVWTTLWTIQTILEKTPGKVVLDHLMLDDVSGQPYVTDDAVTVKAEVLRHFTDVWHAPLNCETLQDHPLWADAYKERSDYSTDV
ncbi:hypothetical protein BG005_003018 [Podila minutissima]|nr:hypothetical protein BG005_003018 [Podila minutissima]